ncbi:MAG: sulfatase [Spirochaetes bacterium]|nr:sulfatase [Spirochaetota bacterium]
MLRTKIKRIVEDYWPSLGGVALMVVLFLYGVVNSLSMSYMGNTSKAVVDFIFQHFFSTIVIFLLKLFGVYCLIGLIIGFAIYCALRSLWQVFPNGRAPVRDCMLVFFASFFVFIVFFLRDIILYPQVYVNNFYAKSKIIAIVFDFLTHRVPPLFFTIILGIIFSFVLLIPIVSALRKRMWQQMFLFSAVSVFAIIIIAYCIHNPTIDSRQKDLQFPDVLILGADALRVDHFSGYGYHRDTTPAIDELIKEGVSFTRTYIEVPRTFPSWVSILTGQFSATHGIRHMFPTSRELNRDFHSIAKTFRQKGYYTAVVGDYAADIFPRIDLGFERVNAPYFNFNTIIEQAILENHTFILPFITSSFGLLLFPSFRDSAYFCPPSLVCQKVIDEINRAGDRPFFITAFFSSTHFPYAPPYPYYLRYADPNYRGQYKYFKQRIISLEGKEKESVDADDIKQINALYDGGLRAFDDAVGEIIAQLKASRRLDSTIVIIVSDHGENLYERNLGMGHGEHFRGHYAIQIPFIVRYPKILPKGRKYEGIVRVVDIAPTILELAGEKPTPHMEGISLVRPVILNRTEKLVAFGETGIWFDNTLREDLFFQKLRILYPDITGISHIDFHFGNEIILRDEYRDLVNLAKHRYAYDGRYKLIYMPLVNRTAYELYDSLYDPNDLHDISKTNIVQLTRMKTILFKWISRHSDVIEKREIFFPLVRH